MFLHTKPNLLVKGWTILTQSITRKGASSISRQVEEEEAFRTIKLEDLVKMVLHVQPSFKDLDSPKDDPIIIVDDSDEHEDADKDEFHPTTNTKTEDASVLKSSSPRSSQIQELTNQVLILQSQKHKLELGKNKAKAEAALLRAQPSFPNMRQLNELLVKPIQTEFSKILSAHDFSSSLPTELKELPSKFNELTKEVKGLKKQVNNLEIKLPGDLKEIPNKLEDFTKTVTIKTVQAKLKTLDALPSLLNKVTNALNQFAHAIASKKNEDEGVPSAGQAGTKPAEGEKNINQATISYDSDDDETHVIGSMVESSKIKKVKKFIFVTEDGKHIHLTKEQINQQKKIEEEAKAKATKRKSELRKEELVDLLGPEIHSRMDYIHITKAELGINLDIPLSKQDPLDKLNDLANKKRKHVDDIRDYFKENKRINSSVQYEDHLAGTVLNEHVLGMIMFNSYYRQDLVTTEDLKDFSNTMLYTVHEIFFRRHQGPKLDDHARTFSSLLLAEVHKRNLNPLKQMRTIEQLRQ
ncbi:hypothetical protein Tco_1104078 [Tanacetum coccineum]